MSLGVSFVDIPANKLESFESFEQAVKTSVSSPLFYREGMNSTVTVEKNAPHNIIFLKNNGKVEAALPLDWSKPAPTSDARTQVLLGTLPLLNNNISGIDVLVIGLGSGITAGAMLQSDRINKLTICELEPAVFSASRFFDAVNWQPLRDEYLREQKVLPISGDGRALLTRSPQCYDIIVSQPSEPWISGASDLFTGEFWNLARGRLKPFGVFCQWLQLYCIDQETLSELLATFADAFPATYVFQPAGGGEILLLGYQIPNPYEPFTKEHVLSDRLYQSNLLPVLAKVGINDAQTLARDLVLSSDDVHGLVANIDKSRFNTDANLKTEYRMPPELLFNEDNLRANLRYLRAGKAKDRRL